MTKKQISMGYGFETASPDRYEILKDFAKKNRREMTPCERILWQELRKKPLGAKFRRQHPIGDYIADFVCLSENLVVEVDGGYHERPEQQYDDAMRSASLQSVGFRVIRFSNEEVEADVKSVLRRIKEEIINKNQYE